MARRYERNISMNRIRRILTKKIEAVQRHAGFAQGLTGIISRTTIIQAGTTVTIAGPVEIKSLDDPGRDPAVQLILEPTAILSISG